MNSNLEGMSRIPCANKDMIPAVMIWIFLDNDKGIRFMRGARKGAFSTIVIHDYPIFAALHYNLESITAALIINEVL
jgi:hypothetical protein